MIKIEGTFSQIVEVINIIKSSTCPFVKPCDKIFWCSDIVMFAQCMEERSIIVINPLAENVTVTGNKKEIDAFINSVNITHDTFVDIKFKVV